MAEYVKIKKYRTFAVQILGCMLDKLKAIKNRWENIGKEMNDPNVMSDMKKYIKLNKDYKELEPIVQAYEVYKNVLDNIDSTKELLKTEKDEEFRSMAKEKSPRNNSSTSPRIGADTRPVPPPTSSNRCSGLS